MKAAFYTLGCKVNQNETGALIRIFESSGYEIVDMNEEADIYVVNSCTVTAGGDKKSRQWLRRAKRQNVNAITVLTGCYPQAFPESAAKVNEADIITGSNARSRLINNIESFILNKQRIIDIVAHQKGDKFESLPLQDFKGHTRAFLKIEDGCNRQCAYCIIPKARGRVRSLSVEEITQQLSQLAANGYAEVVLSGINLSSYGQDNGSSLAEAVEKAARIDGIERIRLGSLEPDLMTDECIERLSNVDKLCPQFHLALQSGCDKTLRQMHRLYNTAQYEEVVKKLRIAFDNPTFTTDIIVGFPDESEEDFNSSVNFIEKIGFLKVHVFSYSKREGTKAAEMSGQIDENEKLRRSRFMQNFADKVRKNIILQNAGKTDFALLETPVNANTFTAYTKSYIPVLIKADGKKPGDIVPVVIGAFDGERCSAIIND